MIPSLRGAGKIIGKELGSPAVQKEAEGAGEKAGGKMASGIGSALKKGAALLGVAGIGATVAQTFADAIGREKLGDKTAASLGLTDAQSRTAGQAAGKLYAGAYGESMGDVTTAVESVMSSITGMSSASPKELETVTASVLDIATAFDLDVSEAARNVGILMKSGLAPDAESAMDLITTSLQKVPTALRGDVTDATEEYSQFFSALGISGPAAMGLLVKGAEDGSYGIDKMGDSIKEFTIRATDMSDSTVGAYDALGLNSKKTTADLLAGGDRAKGAFDKIIGGLKGMKDPAAQSQAALALFGTPLEDLGTSEIPKFLEGLTSTESSLGDVKGATKEMGDTLNNNLGTKMEGWKRSLQTLASDGIMALIEGFDSGKASGEGFTGVMSTVGSTVKNVSTWIGENKVAVQTMAAAVLGAVAAYKAYRVAMAITGAVKAFTAATKGATIAQKALNLVMRANPIGIIITAVGALVAALVWFFTKTELGQKIVKGAWKGIKTAIKSVADWWTDTAWPAIKKVIDWFGNAFLTVKDTIGGAVTGIVDFFRKAPGRIKTAFGKGWNWLSEKITAIVGSYGTPSSGTVLGRVRILVDFFKSIGPKLGSAAGQLWGWLTDKLKGAVGTYAAGGGGVKGMLWGIVNFVKNTLPAKIKTAAANIWSGLIGNALDVVGGVMKLVGKIPGVNGKITLSAGGVSKVYEYAQGGVLPGYTPGRDVHDFFSPTGGRLSLSGGEAIMRPEFTRAVGGAAGVARLNSMARRGRAFAGGGIWGMEKFRAPSALPGFIKALVNATLGRLTVPSLLNAVGEKMFGFLLGGGGDGTAAPGGGVGGGALVGNLNAMAMAAKALDPTARVTSGYRPGAITATGVPSYHGRGRAIDLVSSNMGALWDKLYAAYGKSSPELFFSGRSFSRFGKRGAPRSDHWDHVHWAMKNGGVLPKLYDQGGWVPSGGMGLNLTGKPEAFLTPEESAGLKEGMSGGPLVNQMIVRDERTAVRELEALRRQQMTRARLTGVRR